MSIRFKNVCKSFSHKAILSDLSFEIQSGEILFILGKSGTGKSVTLKHIVGLMKPDTGQIWVDHEEITKLHPAELPRLRKKCGMVFQLPALLDSLTIYENIALGLQNLNPDSNLSSNSESNSDQVFREKVCEKLNLVRLDQEILNHYPNEISFGMQKRVALARTLALEPDYLLFDEPTTGFDPITTQAINELIVDLSQRLQFTIIVVSHDIASALQIADRILVLDQSKILALDTPEKIKTSKIPLIQDFLAEVFV